MFEKKIPISKLRQQEEFNKQQLITLKAFLFNDSNSTSIESFNNILQIIKSCNMHSIDDNWRLWQDDYGYCLKISKKRSFTITNKDMIVNEMIVNDLYAYAGIQDLLNISKKILFDKDVSTLLLWGIDDRFKYRKNIIIDSPLIVGLSNLQLLINSENVINQNLIITNWPNKEIEEDIWKAIQTKIQS